MNPDVLRMIIDLIENSACMLIFLMLALQSIDMLRYSDNSAFAIIGICFTVLMFWFSSKANKLRKALRAYATIESEEYLMQNTTKP